MRKIDLVDHSKIDKTRWDNLVDLSPISFPWWRSWYLDLVTPDWKAIIVGNYDFVLPLPVRKKGMINYVYIPIYRTIIKQRPRNGCSYITKPGNSDCN